MEWTIRTKKIERQLLQCWAKSYAIYLLATITVSAKAFMIYRCISTNLFFFFYIDIPLLLRFLRVLFQPSEIDVEI